MTSLDTALAALGSGPLTAAGLARHVFPLFSRVRARPGIYLANHSLGRPLDAMADDLNEFSRLWLSALDDAWEAWLTEREAYRARIAQLIGAPRSHCVIPKTSAGQGLRAVLSLCEHRARVVATRGEFDSIDHILRTWQARGRLELDLVAPREGARYEALDVLDALSRPADLLVISQVLFETGQIMPGLPAIVAAAHAAGARVLVDAYHAVGVIPVDVAALGCDFMIGGSYKYLRGGPGACWLYVAPSVIDAGTPPLDTGWFAKRDPFAYRRPQPPEFAAGGDAFLESTPPVATWFQARSGQRFVLGIGVERLREYSLMQQRRLVALLAEEGIDSTGGSQDAGAFVVVRHVAAGVVASLLKEEGITVDARGPWLRLCPDCLNTDAELAEAAPAVARAMRAADTRG